MELIQCGNLIGRNTATNKVCIDVVDYDIRENVAIFKDRVCRKFGYNNHAALVFLVHNELSRTQEARDLPDGESIGSFFPTGGAAELGLGGKDKKQDVGGYILGE